MVASAGIQTPVVITIVEAVGHYPPRSHYNGGFGGDTNPAPTTMVQAVGLQPLVQHIIIINFDYTKIGTSAHLHETSKATTYNLTQLISRFACPNLRESKCSTYQIGNK